MAIDSLINKCEHIEKWTFKSKYFLQGFSFKLKSGPTYPDLPYKLFLRGDGEYFYAFLRLSTAEDPWMKKNVFIQLSKQILV